MSATPPADRRGRRRPATDTECEQQLRLCNCRHLHPRPHLAGHCAPLRTAHTR